MRNRALHANLNDGSKSALTYFWQGQICFMMHINRNCLEKSFFRLRDYDQKIPQSLQTNPCTHWRSSRYAVTHVCNKNSNTQSITVP